MARTKKEQPQINNNNAVPSKTIAEIDNSLNEKLYSLFCDKDGIPKITFGGMDRFEGATREVINNYRVVYSRLGMRKGVNNQSISKSFLDMFKELGLDVSMFDIAGVQYKHVLDFDNLKAFIQELIIRDDLIKKYGCVKSLINFYLSLSGVYSEPI